MARQPSACLNYPVLKTGQKQVFYLGFISPVVIASLDNKIDYGFNFYLVDHIGQPRL